MNVWYGYGNKLNAINLGFNTEFKKYIQMYTISKIIYREFIVISI